MLLPLLASTLTGICLELLGTAGGGGAPGWCAMCMQRWMAEPSTGVAAWGRSHGARRADGQAKQRRPAKAGAEHASGGWPAEHRASRGAAVTYVGFLKFEIRLNSEIPNLLLLRDSPSLLG